MKVCGLCGHEMTLERCGSAAENDTPLCHADDHDCYHRWTVYKERPGEPVIDLGWMSLPFAE